MFGGFRNLNKKQEDPHQENSNTTITIPKEPLKPGIYQMIKNANGISVEFESNFISPPDLVFG